MISRGNMRIFNNR